MGMLGKTRGGMWTLLAYASKTFVLLKPLWRLDYLDYLDMVSQLLILSTQRQQEPLPLRVRMLRQMHKRMVASNVKKAMIDVKKLTELTQILALE
jgi:hypothetical protein